MSIMGRNVTFQKWLGFYVEVISRLKNFFCVQKDLCEGGGGGVGVG